MSHGPTTKAGAKMAKKILNLPGVKFTVAVSSAKGGVGKSTVAVNLAVALSSLNRKVGLLDCDVFGPSQHKLMNLAGMKPKMTKDNKLIPLQNYGIKVMSSGFLIPQDQSVVWRGPMVMGAITQLVQDVDWGELNTLVLDLPPGTGDVHLTLTQQLALSGAVVVSTPQDIALIDAKRGIDMFRKVNVPILGIIENMSYYICPKCGDKSDIFGCGGAEETARQYKVPFLGGIPLHREIRTTSDAGTPITVCQAESAAAAPYFAIAKEIARQLDAGTHKAAAEGPSISMDD